MLKKTFLLISLSLPHLLSAQQLTGTVTDSESGIPIGFASIGLTKTIRVTNADQDGRFTLAYTSITVDDSLVISCVGYATTKLALQKDKSFYNIQLQRKASVLREVIIRSFYKKDHTAMGKRANAYDIIHDGNKYTGCAFIGNSRNIQSPGVSACCYRRTWFI